MTGPHVAALRVSGVSHAFGAKQALSEVSFEVPPGSFTALLGVNGAGKSTLFNLITRLYDNVSGAIEVCGHDVRRAPRKALASLGVVFQSRSLDANLTVRQNFLYQGALYGLSGRETLRRAEPLLERVRLIDRLNDKVRNLSGGQSRRVEIARGLLHEPKLLLCDEATAGLDVQSRREIVEQVHALAAEAGAGVLWATHLTDEIIPEDRVVVLHQGRVLAVETAATLAGDRLLADAFIEMTNGDGVKQAASIAGAAA